jgi:TfoX/Sxy family transcriptional regulator of competence genes
LLCGSIRQRLARKKGIEQKKMFGGIGFLLNGNVLVGVWKHSLIVRLGPDQGEDALLELTSRGGAMNGWVLLASVGVEDHDQLTGWIQQAVKFVGKLPAK